MASSPDRLTPLQRDLLLAFFEREQGFFLTGVAALAGFYLHHRETTDLDFFTHDSEAFERGAFAWVLSRVDIPDGASLPAGVSAAETRAFLENLVERMVRAAAPPAK